MPGFAPIRVARLALLAAALLFAPCAKNARALKPDAPPGSALSIPQAVQVQPEQLKEMLGAAGSARPVVIQVGSHVLYAEAHIPGSSYAGPAALPAGLALLRKQVATLAHNQLIVLYCGCCPWDRCPNIAAGLNQLQSMGFTNVKVLYIASNFGADWVSKGYPVAKGR
jgi:thiosulfate/3-mercaptopyruvate sulfurtransferase